MTDEAARSAQQPRSRLSKPAPPHNPLYGWGVCGCVECSRKVLAAQCPKVVAGQQCGAYRHGRNLPHTLLVATAFLIAEERVRLDA